MSTVNLTVRVDEGTKREFDVFCENVGLNATSAVNMFIKTVVRTRALPFIVTDAATEKQEQVLRLGFLDLPPLPDSFFDPLPEDDLIAWGL